IHAAISRLHVQRLKSSHKPDVPVAGVCLYLAIEFPRFYSTVARAQADVALQCVHRDAAVSRVQINGATEPVGLHCAVTRVNRQIPAESAYIHSSIACVDLQVALLRHAHLDVQLPGVVAPAKANSPMSGNPGDKLNLVAILAGVDSEISSQFV